ncbi:HD domain-containing protein [Leptospira gomenensis]|uniref:Bifunctional uridylyltransferase/uridylyl-removing enzyme n=1 Tax=Leptospira gomenensis TaxID=2484974 RepID=A0A5F1YB01_9LEPT|nr:HD domain-containing protein [Leptospira gomenensis]TGK33268.1 HD domain-containing protein [Leptospira gomenensis]TGK45138.1 HD domain-containing protein [Leptospira gomenensis]TGK50924.1 HD domain-containing protein [Leptospira gomenensis]TGK56547.1 HD domain-containing protein [Leptospira gomenensis]
MPLQLDIAYSFQRLLEKSKNVGGRLVSRQLTHIVDSFILSRFETSGVEFKSGDELCLVAMGGYGRMELSPHSDIDLLYLHNGIKEQRLEAVISKINTYLYDSGKEVGHACRTIKECFRYLDDMSSYHAFLDSRFLAGSRALFEKFKADFLEKLPEKRTKYYNETKEEILSSRFLKEERPILLSEPNLKTDLCGLRDIQYMFWMEKSVRNLPSLGGLSILPVFQRGEIQLLQEAYDFLLRTRIAMHVLTGRKTDRLDLNLQQEVAEYLGFGTKSELSSVEKFMHVLYEHQKNIYFIIRTYLDSIIEKRKSSEGESFPYENLHFFRIGDTVFPPVIGTIFTNPHTIYRDVMLSFRMIQERNLQVSGTLLNEFRFASNFLDDDFKYSPEVNEEFLKILRTPKERGRVLKLMHESGILGAILPEFGACTNFPLFSYHHEFTVDEHTLLILHELDVLDRKRFPDPEVQKAYDECSKAELLALAVLLHDAGKVKEGDHSEYGAELAVSVGDRLGLSEEDTDLCRFLVEKHTLMSELSSKRDISDPKLIFNFARTVGSRERLRKLYILTVIDTKSVGSGVLTNWKSSILNTLYLNTIPYLVNDSKNAPDDSPKRDVQLDNLKTYLISKEGLDEDISKAVIRFADEVIPSSYLNTVSNRKILKNFKAVGLLARNESIGMIFEAEQDPAFVTIDVVTVHRPEILLDLSCAVSSEGLSLLGMKSYTLGEFWINSVQVIDSAGGGNLPSEKLERLESKLKAISSGNLRRESIAFQRTDWNPRKPAPESIVNRSVMFDNADLADVTIMEVRMPDSVGLVYKILQIILESDLKVRYLRVSTSADYAYDSFYLQTADGSKIEDSELLSKLRDKILKLQFTEHSIGEIPI